MFKNSRWLLQALILSGTLNVLMMVIFFYFLIRDNPLHFSYTPKLQEFHAAPPCSKSFLETLHVLPVAKLLELLKDERIIESGYRVRDFSLGALASHHHYDVQRALGKKILEERTWVFEGNSFCLFPGLKPDDFLQIETFFQKEIWPLTTKGLFLVIQGKGVQNAEKELLFQFCHSPEFVILETLFVRAKKPIQRGELIAMVTKAPWEIFSQFAKAQANASDFSPHTRRDLLLSYLENNSQEAACILLKTDSEFVINELEDQKIGKILDLLPPNNAETLAFAKKVAISPRSQTVFEKAKVHLPQDEVVGRFVPRASIGELRPRFREPHTPAGTKPPTPDPRSHIVQPGESLWLIAKRHHISIEVLMQCNGLQSTVIQPGRVLKLP